MAQGILILYKEPNMTSHTAVAKVRHLFGGEKAGHTGTLDPMATGVLPVLLGRAVKASEYMLESQKHYIANMKLGVTSDTQDSTGTILTTSSKIPTEEQVIEIVSSFVGTIWQTPPMYSALKVNGKKLVDLARKGIEVDREAREITISQILLEKIKEDEYSLDVICSKGTYIRTLCADIGNKLGCGAIMSKLERVEAAGFVKNQSYTLSQLEAMTEAERENVLLPVETLFKQYPKVTTSEFFTKLLKNGQAVSQKKLKTSISVHEKVQLFDQDGFYALGEVNEQEEIKTIKIFTL